MAYNKSHRKIRYVAEKVRLAVEFLADDEGWEDPDDLCGYCARASAMISYELNSRDIEHSLIYSDYGHVHVRSGEYIIDVTATQFHRDMPRVIVRSIDNMGRLQKRLDVDRQYWFASNEFKHPNELYEHQISEDWPEEQIVNTDDLSYLPVKQKKMV